MQNPVLVPLSAQAFNAGDEVTVSIAFNYLAGASTTIYLYAAPYYYNLIGGKARGNGCTNFSEITLPQAETPAAKTASVTFPLTPKASGGIDNGSYGLAVWLQTAITDQDPWVAGSEGVLAHLEEDDILIVSGNSSGGGSLDSLSSMLPMLMMLMMVGMMSPMTQGLDGGGD